MIGERHFSDGSVRYLCKWRGLPYCEATYESAAELEAVGQGCMVSQFQVASWLAAGGFLAGWGCSARFRSPRVLPSPPPHPPAYCTAADPACTPVPPAVLPALPVQERERRIQESRKTVDAQRRAFAESGTRAFTTQPDYLKGGCGFCGWSVDGG